MTMLFMDSFDHYTATLDKWTAQAGSRNPSAIGRFGNGIGSPGTNLGTHLNSVNIAASSEIVVGFAFYENSALFAQPWLQLREVVATHLDFRLDATHKPYITRAGTTLVTSSVALTTGTWYYIEIKATIHDTTGSVELRVDGVTVASATGIDTRNGATGVIDNLAVAWANSGTSQLSYFDDLYVCDQSGLVNNDFLGDVRVQAILPNGNGNSSVLVGSDGNSTDNYLLVDENPPNTTDYVESSTPGDKDTYAFADVSPTSGTVHAVQVLPYAVKTDAGARSIVSVARLSGTEVDSAAKTLSTTWRYLSDIRETKPGGGAWSISDVNAAEFGVKVDA